MYRLDLSDSRLSLPSPIFHLKAKRGEISYQMRSSIDSLNSWDLIENIPFFAVPPDRSFEGLLPVFEVKEKSYSRLQTKISDHAKKSQFPVFFGLPDTVTTLKKIDGKWDCLADDYPFSMEIKSNGSIIEGTISDENLIIEKGTFLNNKLELLVTDTTNHDSYSVSAILSSGNLKGEYHALTKSESGKFSARQPSGHLEQYLTPMVTPLYEFQQNDGTYFYSVDEKITGMKRTEKPVCKVWKNPSSIMGYDFETKPKN
jgi:hypothetical protein